MLKDSWTLPEMVLIPTRTKYMIIPNFLMQNKIVNKYC